MKLYHFVMRVRKTTALDICCILYLRLLRPGKGNRVQAVHSLNLCLERSVKQQAHYISELATLVLMSPGSRIEIPVAVNVLLNGTVTSMYSF